MKDLSLAEYQRLVRNGLARQRQEREEIAELEQIFALTDTLPPPLDPKQAHTQE